MIKINERQMNFIIICLTFYYFHIYKNDTKHINLIYVYLQVKRTALNESGFQPLEQTICLRTT